jgi:molybdopterin synthase catalytic subunit
MTLAPAQGRCDNVFQEVNTTTKGAMRMRVSVEVRPDDFDLGKEMQWMRQDCPRVGAIASFVGLVRDFSERPEVEAMLLEHYPGMTERSLEQIAQDACGRWELQAVRIVHRVGELRPGDQIVLVLTSSAHRGDAFAACQFIMDYLKVQAPFWKKEKTQGGDHWVEARDSDAQQAQQWTQSE